MVSAGQIAAQGCKEADILASVWTTSPVGLEESTEPNRIILQS